MKKKEKLILINTLHEISDEANHVIGTEADNHREVAVSNSKEIKRLVRKALNLLS